MKILMRSHEWDVDALYAPKLYHSSHTMARIPVVESQKTRPYFTFCIVQPIIHMEPGDGDWYIVIVVSYIN